MLKTSDDCDIDQLALAMTNLDAISDLATGTTTESWVEGNDPKECAIRLDDGQADIDMINNQQELQSNLYFQILKYGKYAGILRKYLRHVGDGPASISKLSLLCASELSASGFDINLNNLLFTFANPRVYNVSSSLCTQMQFALNDIYMILDRSRALIEVHIPGEYFGH